MKNFLTQIPVAHRGLHGDGIPENSLAAFERAAQAGYAVETDVRLSADGRLVILHDDNLLRMTGIDKKVIDCTAEELQNTALAGTKETIPLFSDFLKLLAGRVPLLLEIKYVPEANKKHFLKQIAAEMKDYPGEVAVQSFHPFYVRYFRKLRPDLPCGFLAFAYRGGKKGHPLENLKMKMLGAMSLNFLIKPDFISYLHSDYPCRATDRYRGIKLAWTVHSEAEEAAVRRYADNIIFEGFLPKRG